MNARNAQGGFTLLEVMVALSIIATALVTLLGTHLLSLNLAQRQKEQTLAAMLARGKLEEIMTTKFDSIADDSGDFADMHPGYGWESEVEETDTENLKSIKIIISYPNGDFTPTTFVARDLIE